MWDESGWKATGICDYSNAPSPISLFPASRDLTTCQRGGLAPRNERCNAKRSLCVLPFLWKEKGETEGIELLSHQNVSTLIIINGACSYETFFHFNNSPPKSPSLAREGDLPPRNERYNAKRPFAPLPFSGES